MYNQIVFILLFSNFKFNSCLRVYDEQRITAISLWIGSINYFSN